MGRKDELIPEHGGYRKLKSFQIGQLVYDITVRFCDCYIEKRSRTHDQMVQAARSGVQNIAEGSQASGTSKKTELKLTNVARASLEELKLDYEDFLRHRGMVAWEPTHQALERFKKRRCTTLEDVRDWIKDERERRISADKHGQTKTNTNSDNNDMCVSVRVRPLKSVSSSEHAANAALSLLNLCCYLLDRQIKAQADAFEKEGGFTERLYQRRNKSRQ